jgi:DNA-binding PadR family transcriptional regulator
MPAPNPTSEPSDDLLLAALDRAGRHQRREGRGVLLVALKDHLDLPRHSGTTVRLRPALDRLQGAGLIRYGRHNGLKLWTLTASGHARLNQARQAGTLGSLPESPQHRQWAHARAVATERLPEFRAELRRLLDQAGTMLDAETANSDAWFDLTDRLHEACWRHAAATYITSEWAEPDDAHPDLDTHRERNRRNIHAWEGM